MSLECSPQSIYLQLRNYTHPLDEVNRRLWSIMSMAAKDIEAMTDEKGAEWAGEEH